MGRGICFANYITFHIPLQRYFSAFMHNAIMRQNASLEQLMSNSKHVYLMNLLEYPLHIFATFHEIHANIWAKNGICMKEECIYYTRNDFCRSNIEQIYF